MRAQALSLAMMLASVSDIATAAAAAPADAAADQIVVTGLRAAKTARAEEKAAANLVSVQAAEDIVKYPDFNAAEALGRIPGVNLAIDTGEGRFVNIRGIDGNLNGATFGGVTMLNTQPGGTYFGGGGRAVEFDTVPIGAVDRIVVRKTGMPDQEAEGLGGSIELTPRTAIGLKGPFFEGTIGGGYQPAHKHGGVFVGEAAAGTTFGPDRTLAIVLTGSFHTDHRGFDDVEPSLLDNFSYTSPDPKVDSPNKALDQADLRRYNYNRRRFGFGGELDWNPNPTSHYYIRANVAGYTESVNRQILQYRDLGNDVNGDPIPIAGNGLLDPNSKPNGFLAPAAGARVSLRDEQETAINFITSVGGRNDFGSVIIDYQIAYTAATYHRDYDYNSSFGLIGGKTFAVAYDNITNTLFPRITPIGFNPNDPTQFALRALGNTTERAHDHEYSAVLNFTIPTTLLGGEGDFKFGGKLRLRDKIDQPFATTYAGFAKTPLSSLLGPGPFTDFYSGNYSVGYSPDAQKLRPVFSSLPATPSAVRNAGGYFNDTENVYSGYGEYQGKFGKLGVLFGVRVENTDGTYRGTSVVTDKDKNISFVPTSRKSNYTDLFPTVQLRYDLTDVVVARATYSTGIGRPGFLQLKSGASVDVGAQAVSVGNPNLKPITGNNFDATIEYYLPDSGVLSAGFFDKEFRNYIIQSSIPDPHYPGIDGVTRVNSYSNVRSSYARGFEAAYSQKFSFLPAPFDGLGANANVTYVDSKFEIRPGEFSQLPAAAKWTYNIGAFYEANKIQLRVALQHNDAAIFGVGGGKGFDTFEAARTTLDLTSSYQLLPHMTVYFNAKNLTNEPLRCYEGSSDRTTQREFYDASYEAGFRFKF